MADYVFVNTDFTDATGAAFNGYLIATMMTHVVTNNSAGGAKDYVAPFRKKFYVVSGVARIGSGNGSDLMSLPVTQDSNPSGVPVILEVYDNLGHLHQVVEFIPPRIGAVSAAQATVNLKDYL